MISYTIFEAKHSEKPKSGDGQLGVKEIPGRRRLTAHKLVELTFSYSKRGNRTDPLRCLGKSSHERLVIQ